jgi:amino acid adenylation domain-containing protein
MLGAYGHQDVPLERLAETLKVERSLSHSPLFQVLLALQNLPDGELDLAGLTISPLEVDEGHIQFDLSLFVAPRPGNGGLEARLHAASSLFDPVTTGRILGHWRTLLAGAASALETPISALPLLTPVERGQLESWDADRRAAHPEGLLHGLFEHRAELIPDHLALVAGDARLTYRELEERSRHLAARLTVAGAGPETGVAVCLERTADLVIALLAVLRSGSFYVPLDPRYPDERLRYLVEDSCASIVVTVERLAERLPAARSVIALDRPERALPGARPATVVAGNLAYLIYTSGSTGRPKAVAIEHRSATVFAHWARGAFTPAELRGVLASTAITFDLSVFELFVTLAWGGTVILAENALDLPRVTANLPSEIEVTLVNTVPSAMAELLRDGSLPASVQTINLAGEALPRSLADLAYARPETVRLCNLYGPSEDTTYSTWTVVERSSERGPTIGRPVDDSRAYIVDRGQERLPIGVPGELCLAGSGLAQIGRAHV